MSVFGYIFLAREKDLGVPENEQRTVIQEYARGLRQPVQEIIIEEAVSLNKAFKSRPAGGNLVKKCSAGDIILVMKAEWVLGSAGEAVSLLRNLSDAEVAMHCIDLGGNISLPEKRRLMVSEGPAAIVQKLLAALIVCEGSRHSQAIRTAKNYKREQGKYLGGPVPFGWEVSKEGYLVPNIGQQQVINAIIAMRKERWSFREISQKLSDEYAVHLSHEGVRKILKSDNRKASTGKK
jgi:DNA invertase Pin-like site-specific DNA recombinase